MIEYLPKTLIAEAAKEFMNKMGIQNIEVFQDNMSNVVVRSDILEALVEAAFEKRGKR